MNILTSDGLGRYTRHGLTFAAGVLSVLGYLSADQAAAFPEAVITATGSSEFWGALLTLAIGLVGSAKNKAAK